MTTMIELVRHDLLNDNHSKLTFEFLLCVQVHLLSLSDLLQNILNDDSIILPDIAVDKGQLLSTEPADAYSRRSKLDVIIRLHHVDIELSFRRSHEDTLIDFDLGIKAAYDQAHIGLFSRVNSPSRHLVHTALAAYT
jgi:hypothetical protein